MNTVGTLRVGVVVPVYNRPAMVLKALDSIAMQTWPAHQVVIVDDGSTDDTAAQVSAWIEAAPARQHFSLRRAANGGAGVARNHGLQALRNCELVAFLDSDDWWPPDFLERLAPQLEACPDAVAVSCQITEVQTDGGLHKIRAMRGLAADPVLWMIEQDAALASATLFRRKAIEACGGFDASLPTGEDCALFLQVALRGAWLFESECSIHYRVHHGEDAHEAQRSRKLGNRYVRWCQLYNDFLQAQNQGHPCYSVWRNALAQRWYRTGRSLERAGQLQQAAHCFRAARVLQPQHAKAIWHSWRLALTTR